MAKIPFTKLDFKVNDNIEIINFKNNNGEELKIEVKKYLPVQDKLEMISKIINQSIDDNGFYNPVRVKIFTVLEVVYAYTNLSFTVKQKENIFKLYDLIVSNGLFFDILKVFWDKEWEEIQGALTQTIDNIYNYKNSVLGILETVSVDYSNLNIDLESIREKLTDPEALKLIKEISPNL